MKKRIQPVIIAVIRKDDKYLLTKRAEIDVEDLPDFLDKWELPGGGMEFGEWPEETLHREVKEELGITVSMISGPQIWTEVRGIWQGVFLCYLCETTAAPDSIILNKESSAYQWVTLDEAKKLATLPGVKEVLSFFSPVA